MKIGAASEPRVRFRAVQLGFVQKCKVIANVLPWIPVPNGERQQKHGFRGKQLRVTCTSEHSIGLIPQ